MMNLKVRIGGFALLVLQFANTTSGSYAATLYVSKDGDGTSGLTWETAFTTVSAGLTASASGDEIWVKSGDYQENVSLPQFSFALRGGFVGGELNSEERDIGTHTTIIGDASYEGRTISLINTRGDTESWPVLLEDLTIRPGQAGGIELIKESYFALEITLRRCVCEYNAIGKTGNSLLASQVNRLNIESCEFIQHGLNAFDGEATSSSLYIHAYHARITNSIFSLDQGSRKGGTVFETVLRLPWFLTGTSNIGVDIINSVIYRSPDASDYGAIRGSITLGPKSPPEVRASNTIVVGDLFRTDDNFVYCNVFDASEAEGVGNLSVDPLFVNPEEGDFRLLANSPCIDSGTVVALAEDIEGNPRPVDIPGVGHSGAAAFDMGAYELQKDNALHGDLNGDGEVDAEDLCLILREWRKGNGQ
jgi:hypothetical protein